MAAIRIKDCRAADIQKIVKRIERFHGAKSEEHIHKIIKNESETKTNQLISSYDVNYCKSIIVSHVKGNIYDMMRKYKDKKIDISTEIRFYRQIIHSYIYEVVYNKIKNAYYRLVKENAECSICFEKIDYRTLYTTQCNHKFHMACHMKWLNHNGHTCPNCRTEL
jgi:hypothetical protein